MNNQLKLSVYEQQDDIKHLKEQYNKEDKDKVREISGAITTMKKNKSVCKIKQNSEKNSITRNLCVAYVIKQLSLKKKG